MDPVSECSGDLCYLLNPSNIAVGVFKVVSAKELYHVWDSVTFPSAVAVIEPYVGGTEVDVDLILEKGRLLYFGVTDNDPSKSTIPLSFIYLASKVPVHH